MSSALSMIPLLEGFTTSSWVLVFLCVALVAFYRYSTSYRGLFEKYGIPVPPAWPVINHWPKFRGGEDAPLDEWFQKFGDTFGTYGMFPHDPVLVSRDLKLLKYILVKDFGNFVNRYAPKLTWASMNRGLFFVEDEQWRRQRHVTTPMFTGGKLRAMMSHVTKSTNSLREVVRLYSNDRELIPVRVLSSRFASEVIARVGFGVDAHSVSREESEFGHNTHKMFRIGNPLQQWVDTISLYFPPAFWVGRRLGLKLDIIDEDSDAYFTRILIAEITRRKEERAKSKSSDTKIKDMLDMFLEVEVPDQDQRLNSSSEKAVTNDEIIGNINLLILAGIETVSSALQSTLYFLAFHQGVQEKVVEEARAVLEDGEDVTYDHIQQLVYTEQVINESMRLQPPVSILVRKTIGTRTYDGLTIPGGVNLMIPTGKIHRDPRHWGNDPDKFVPERFSPENSKSRDPMAFMPFGWGPRLCVGQRFAMMELKVVIATLVRDFRFEMSERSEPKLGQEVKIVQHEIAIKRPEKPVMIEAFLRS